jgi:tetratricopeptide (TPR) repeat protein
MKIFITLFLVALSTFPSRVIQATPQSRDNWRSVRTNHLFVIGNAEAENLRQVAVWLEFFHRAFGRIVSRNVIDSSVPTTVIVFRDDASFRPFKPLYQGRPANLAGFFQPGDDVNYIAISLDPGDRDPFSTAFHEYVHLHVKDNIPGAPLWLNEGLAELYGSLQFSGNEALLGVPLPYARYLRQHELLPLNILFSIGTNSEHYNEDDKTGIFYGQSWALVHYLMLGDRNRQNQFKSFLNRISQGDTSAKALEGAFGASLDVIEQEFNAYVRRGDFAPQRLGGVDDPQTTAYTAMQRTSLSEGEANYYLGDLLLHIGRQGDAERYFKQAIAIEPGLVPAHEALGILSIHQRRYADAKKYLEKAVSSSQNHLIHYFYAYVLSREGVSPAGKISGYSRESAAVMREHLLHSIKLAPNYAPSHYLLAVVNFVADERLDEALEMVQRARQLAPSKTSYALLQAQIYMRRSDAAAARQILEPLTRDSDQSVRTDAQDLLESLSGTAGSNRSKPTSGPAVSSAMISEPEKTGSSRMLGGESGSVTINDGRTIDNSGSLPTVDEVLERYINALGGAAALKALNNRVIKGTTDIVGHSRGEPFEMYEQAPNKVLYVFHEQGEITKVGFNGRIGWDLDKFTRARMLKGADLAQLQVDAYFSRPLEIKKNFAKVTLAGMSKIGYRDVYVIDLQHATGAVARMYLDAQTFLLARSNTMRRWGTVSASVEIYYDDWREVDGTKQPFSMTYSFPKLTVSVNITEIRHNVVLDPAIFDPPK